MAVIAIVRGHNRGTGASALDGMDEWEWNSKVQNYLRTYLESLGHKVVVLNRDKSLGYTGAMRKHGRDMRRLGIEVAVELHFNSASFSAHGFEFLYWWGSRRSKRLARCIANCFGIKHPRIKTRGDKGIRTLWFHSWNKWRAYSGRGGAFCFLTPCPAVICEPGFASNKLDWAVLRNSTESVAWSYAMGIDDFVKKEMVRKN